MGLDTSHDCWHGPYSSFNRWRTELCKAAGLPPLDLMEGFYDPPSQRPKEPWLRSDRPEPTSPEGLPIRWECLKPDPIYLLLYHSDCDGDLKWKDCTGIADSLEALLPKMGEWTERTKQFIEGLRWAAEKQENVDFH